MPEDNRSYLGDGLYVSHDGYQFKLSASNGVYDHDSVYLEPEVLRSFIEYVGRTLKVKITIDSRKEGE